MGVDVVVLVGFAVGRGEAVEEGTIVGVEEEAGGAVPQEVIVNVNTTNVNQ